MDQVIKESLRLLEAREPHVVCTVVRTTGMTPQKAGARQLIRQDGSRVGTLGGGCVEGDVWYYARQILRENSGPMFREYELTADVAERDGLVCGGKMFFFLEPRYPSDEKIALQKARATAAEAGPPIISVTVVRSDRPDVRVGESTNTMPDGRIFGTVRRPDLLTPAIALGKQFSELSAAASLNIEPGTELLVEAIAPAPTLVILGGGHVGKAVYELALKLAFRIVVIDDREEFANPKRFPQATAVVADFSNPFEKVELTANSFVLVATRGHKYDDQATLAAANLNVRYIGLLGSRRKNLLIFKRLLEHGIALDRIKEIHAPVGLDIGALTPAELAVSIVAELVHILRGGTCRPMKMSADDLERELQEDT